MRKKKKYDVCHDDYSYNNERSFDIDLHVSRKRSERRRGANGVYKTVERKAQEVACSGCKFCDNNYCKKLGEFISNTTCEGVITIPRRIKRYYYCKKSRNKKERYLLGKYRLERIVNNSVGWPPAAARRDKNREYTEDPNETMYIKRYYRANHAPGYSGYLKKQSSRIIRRHKMELPTRGCGYRKYFDYWWELW